METVELKNIEIINLYNAGMALKRTAEKVPMRFGYALGRTLRSLGPVVVELESQQPKPDPRHVEYQEKLDQPEADPVALAAEYGDAIEAEKQRMKDWQSFVDENSKVELYFVDADQVPGLPFGIIDALFPMIREPVEPQKEKSA